MNTYKINPILFGLVGGIITYIILYFDTKFENKKFRNKKIGISDKCGCPYLYTTLKVPLIIGALTWVMATYFEDTKTTLLESNNSEHSLSIFDQDLFTDVPDF